MWPFQYESMMSWSQDIGVDEYTGRSYLLFVLESSAKNHRRVYMLSPCWSFVYINRLKMEKQTCPWKIWDNSYNYGHFPMLKVVLCRQIDITSAFFPACVSSCPFFPGARQTDLGLSCLWKQKRRQKNKVYVSCKMWVRIGPSILRFYFITGRGYRDGHLVSVEVNLDD